MILETYLSVGKDDNEKHEFWNVYLYLYICNIHYITLHTDEESNNACVCMVFAIYAHYAHAFFWSTFFTFEIKEAHLVFPCEVLVKQIQFPEPPLRHLAISAQLPVAQSAICSRYRFGKRPKSSPDLAEAAKAVAPAAGSHSIWKITRGTRIQLVLQIVLAQPAQTITGTDRRCGPAIASHTTGTKSCNHKFLLLALAQSDAHAVWFIWRLYLQMTGDPLGSFQRPHYSVL